MASGAAKRYVQAVLQLAKEQGTLDAWQRDLDRLAAVARQPGVAQYLHSPAVETSQKRRILESELGQAQPEAINLVRMLLENDRIDIIPRLVETFTEARMAEQGIVIADVTTADELSVDGRIAVQAQLEQMLNKKVEMRLHTDPEIIGGIIARVGDRLIDGSVINQLRRLRARLATGMA